ncbi:MAG: hypothetical protein IPM94_08305 [bacterium]|nr:hypothetical protein [bacterium]
MNRYDACSRKVRPIAEADLRSDDKMQAVTALLAANAEGFDCVAFFLVDPDNPRQLLIGRRIRRISRRTSRSARASAGKWPSTPSRSSWTTSPRS